MPIHVGCVMRNEPFLEFEFSLWLGNSDMLSPRLENFEEQTHKNTQTHPAGSNYESEDKPSNIKALAPS